MNFLIFLCLATMVFFVVITILESIKKKGIERIKYLRDYKKGSVLRIYIVSVPLFWLGAYYSGEYSLGITFWVGLKDAVSSIALRFEQGNIAKLMNDNSFYRGVMWVYFVLSIINTFFFALTIFGQKINNFIKRSIAFSKSKINIVVGLNDETKTLIKSMTGDNVVVIIFQKSQDDIDYLTTQKVPYMVCDKSIIVKKLGLSIKKVREKEINVVVNTNSDMENILLTKQFCQYICSEELYTIQKDIKRGYNLYVLASLINISAFNKFVLDAKGCIHIINKHLLISMQFTDKYPLTQFMDYQHINYESATIKSEVELNVLMVGFGKVNQQIFLSMVANNQFVCNEGDKIITKPVNYFIFDKTTSQNDKNLNHNYFRYENEVLNPILASDDVEELKKDYFALPDLPANTMFIKKDINDIDFYTSIKKSLTVAKGKCQYNYIIVSFGDDLENIDLAKKIQTKLEEWEISAYTKLFVRVKDYQLINSNILSEQGVYAYGSDAEIFSKEVIIDSSLERLARLRDKSYIETKYQNNELTKQLKFSVADSWYNYHPIKRKSNIYAGISIRSKLHLLGLDYLEKIVDERLKEDVFMEMYAKGDMPEYGEKTTTGKREIIYPLNHIDSKRKNFAIMEHLRWNAFMISEGFVPAKKKQCFQERSQGKDYQTRIHLNLTTFDGLYEYRKLMAKIKFEQKEYENIVIAEKAEDVIKYDYHIMDDIFWLLDKINYSIVYKDNSKL